MLDPAENARNIPHIDLKNDLIKLDEIRGY